jgi:hypothetical protein
MEPRRRPIADRLEIGPELAKPTQTWPRITFSALRRMAGPDEVSKFPGRDKQEKQHENRYSDH